MRRLWRRTREPLAVGDLVRLRQQLAYRFLVFGTAVFVVTMALVWEPLSTTGHGTVLVLDAVALAWATLLLVVDRPPLAPSAATVLPPLALLVVFFHMALGPNDVRPALVVITSVTGGILGGLRGALWTTAGLAAAVVGLYVGLPTNFPGWTEALAAPVASQALFVTKTFLLAGVMGGLVGAILDRMGHHVRAGREADRNYRLLAENVSDVVWTADMQLRNTYMSPSIERLRGFTPDEIRQMPIEERILEPSLTEARAVLRDHLDRIRAGDPEGWEPVMLDLLQPHKGGGTVITSNHVRIVAGPDGRPASIVGVSRDVTEARRVARLHQLQAQMATRAAGATTVEETATAVLDAVRELADEACMFLLQNAPMGTTGETLGGTTGEALEGATEGALILHRAPTEPGGEGSPTVATVSEGLRAALAAHGSATGHTTERAALALLAELGWDPLPPATPLPADGAGWGGHRGQARLGDETWSLCLLPLGDEPGTRGGVLLARATGGAFEPPAPRGLGELLQQGAQLVTYGLARADLDASERRYRALTENSPDTIMRLDRTGRYLYANPAVQELTGLPPEHFVGGTLATVGLPPDLRETFEHLLEKTVCSNQLAELTYFVPTTKRWVEMQVVPERDARGGVGSVITISRDVTSRRQAERALETSELRYRTLFEAANDGLLLLTPPAEGGRFVEANPRAAQLLGVRIEDLVGRTPAELSPPVQPNGRPSRALAQDKIRAALEGQPQVFEWRHQIRSGDGHVRTVDVEVSLHRVDLPGGVRLQTTWRDLTEFKRAARALEREAQFRAILGDIANDFIRLPVGEFDDGIHRALAAIAQALGATCAVLLGGDPGTGVFELRHRWLAEGAASCGGARPLDGEAIDAASYAWLARLETVVRVEHEPSPGTVVLEPLASQGRCLGALAFRFASPARELSEPEARLVMLTAATLATTLERQRAEDERRRLDAQLRHTQKLEAVGLLAGGVAHDFNNILCAIGGTAELLADDAEREALDGPSVRAMTRDVLEATERAATLTRQLLAFARQDDTEPEDVPVAKALSALRQMLRRLLGEQVTLEMTVNEAVGAVHMAPGQFDQVVVNLVVNARDAMPEGGVVTVEARPLGPAAAEARGLLRRPYVLVSVRDTGHGMSEEIRERIFDPFFTTKDVGKGTGLGLSTVHGIIDGAHGTIEVESEPGAGATFRIYLPRVEPSTQTSSRPASPPQPDARETVLLVEDAPDVRALAAALLKRLGYQVIQAPGPHHALRILSSEDDRPTIDLLMTDVVMPHMNGRELVEAARARYPSLPVLFTSGYTRNILDGAEVLGHDVHFLPKPYTVAQLAEAVRAALGGPS